MIYNTIFLKTAPWTINQLIVKLELTKLSKTKAYPISFQEKFLNIQNNFPDHHHIYTDGSKQGMKVGCAAICQNQNLLKIHSVEVTAIDLTMNIIVKHKSSKFIIQISPPSCTEQKYFNSSHHKTPRQNEHSL